MDKIDLKSCRICLSVRKPMCQLFNYKLSCNYAEMLTAVADVKVSDHDGLPGKLCLRCANALEKAYFLKTVAEKNDKKLHRLLAKQSVPRSTKKLVFDSIKDIKSEISELSVKNEPKWELDTDVKKPVDTIDGKDVVIANTVIRKCDSNGRTTNVQLEIPAPDVSWKKTVKNDDDNCDVEFLDEDVFQGDDDADADYVPPDEAKFKKPRVLKPFKPLKVIRKDVPAQKMLVKTMKIQKVKNNKQTTMITCYPIMKNGQRGAPITLKRPKDATVIKNSSSGSYSVNGSSKPIRIVRSAKPVIKTREKLVCPVCGILTFTLGNHMSTHNEKKKFTCPQCPKTFSQKSNMEAHLKYHSGIKDHICEICGAGFYNQKSLQRHNLIHKGERPFACNLCSKTFIAKDPLTVHMRIHTGEKNHICEICCKRFRESTHLKTHMRMHTGEKPYSCKVCNVAFSYKVNLNNHVFKVHGVNLKFKSIHTVTEDVLQKEIELVNEARTAISHILPVPAAAAHETVTMTHTLPFNT